jgi:mycothiol synthase
MSPSVRCRPFRDTSDYETMANIRSIAGQFDQVDPRSARESIPTAADLAQTFPFAVAVDHPDLVLVEHDTQVVGYSHVWWRWTENTGARIYLHLSYVLPAWRHHEIARALVQWAERRIRVIAHEEHAEATAQFATNVSTTEPDVDRLMQSLGYRDVRRMSDMLLEPNHAVVLAPLPERVLLRVPEPDQYRSIYQAWKDGLSDFWTSTPESDADYQEFLADYIHTDQFDPSLWQIAWAGDLVVGVVIAVHNQHGGRLEQVVVRRAWHRQGIGRALLGRALDMLHQHGVDHVRLYTDAANEHGARRLYEQFGFREVKQHLFYRKPLANP